MPRAPENNSSISSRFRSQSSMLAVMYALAVALNFAWELAQSPLYAVESYVGTGWLSCFVASLGDGLMVLLLFGVALLVTQDRLWYMRRRLRGYGTVVIAGAALAVAVEWIALHVLHTWAYAETMPRIPGTQIGLVPVLQMIVLPPLIIVITAAFRRRAAGDEAEASARQ